MQLKTNYLAECGVQNNTTDPAERNFRAAPQGCQHALLHGESYVVAELLSETTLTVRCWKRKSRGTSSSEFGKAQLVPSHDGETKKQQAEMCTTHAECDILIVARCLQPCYHWIPRDRDVR